MSLTYQTDDGETARFELHYGHQYEISGTSEQYCIAEINRLALEDAERRRREAELAVVRAAFNCGLLNDAEVMWLSWALACEGGNEEPATGR